MPGQAPKCNGVFNILFNVFQRMSDVTVQLFIDLFLGWNCSQVVQTGKYTGQILDTGNGVAFCSVRN